MAAAMREDRTPTPDSTLARDSMEPGELLPRTGPGSYNTDPLLEKLREAVAQIPHIRGPNGDSGGSVNEKADDVFMAI
ncbi:hypothetical protein EVJ58_g4973 [Rhodofomes roseus]|uniref:Uncharacterized protein n=1 Tax=Rhodofomes roseus TaxID=34475 RepID=A0A4Y9YIC4_9APHY|nr:hypothetical protein EVJ58_g4973 [Rhodofomes roseus]